MCEQYQNLNILPKYQLSEKLSIKDSKISEEIRKQVREFMNKQSRIDLF